MRHGDSSIELPRSTPGRQQGSFGVELNTIMLTMPKRFSKCSCQDLATWVYSLLRRLVTKRAVESEIDTRRETSKCLDRGHQASFLDDAKQYHNASDACCNSSARRIVSGLSHTLSRISCRSFGCVYLRHSRSILYGQISNAEIWGTS